MNDKTKNKYLKINYVPGPNIGDNVFPYMLHKLNIPFSWVDHNEHKKIISTGSIIGVASKPDTIIWGSGIINQNTKMHDESKPKLVRGIYSRKSSTTIRKDIPLGDPALALPTFFKKPRRVTHTIGIIPHMIHFDRVCKYLEETKVIADYKIIDPNAYYYLDRFENYIKEILSCEKIISTTLHGLIIANAYKVPAAWWEFDNSLMGDGTKFLDYSSAFDHVIENNNNIVDIKNDTFWRPDDEKLSKVTNNILDSSPIFNDLDSGYYTNTKSNIK
jgi:pyruvyltransferase